MDRFHSSNCTRTIGRLLAALTTVALALVAAATPALAHAERLSSDPKPGSNLNEPPQHLYVNFSEPPTGDSVAVVTDGCGNDVVGTTEVTNKTLHLTLDEGQPGRWKVETSVISGLDGHPTKDSFRFRVQGERDCSAAPDGGDDEEGGGTDTEDSGSSLPILLIAGGAVVLVGGAAAIRMRS